MVSNRSESLIWFRVWSQFEPEASLNVYACRLTNQRRVFVWFRVHSTFMPRLRLTYSRRIAIPNFSFKFHIGLPFSVRVQSLVPSPCQFLRPDRVRQQYGYHAALYAWSGSGFMAQKVCSTLRSDRRRLKRTCSDWRIGHIALYLKLEA